MGKRITFKTANGAVCVPLKAFVAVEIATHILTIGIATVIGYAFGHPITGALVGVGISATGEIAEYLVVKKAMQSGKLSMTVR
jgi:hypothetical protein